MAAGGRKEAFAAMDRATALQARMPKPIGRPYPVKGADELYGELLLPAGRPKDAVVWFERALGPHAESQSRGAGPGPGGGEGGRIAKSRARLQAVSGELAAADPGLPELDEARTALKAVAAEEPHEPHEKGNVIGRAVFIKSAAHGGGPSLPNGTSCRMSSSWICASRTCRSPSRARSSRAGSRSLRRARSARLLPESTSTFPTSGSPRTIRRQWPCRSMTHPRLERLEEAQMLQVEGGDHDWCMRILRHEAGHVIDNAYRLRLNRQRRSCSAVRSVPTRSSSPSRTARLRSAHRSLVRPKPPDEDFAETFAVWLTPDSNWERRYRGGRPSKLEYMDTLMRAFVAKNRCW